MRRQRDLVGQHRLGTGDVAVAELALADHEDPVAIGLDDVGLVDAELLRIGARERTLTGRVVAVARIGGEGARRAG